MNEHFSEGLWIDFVRRVTAPADAIAMSAHLASGCPRCCQAVEWLSVVAGVGATGAAQAVPPELVAIARALFVPRENWAEKLERLAATLIWQQQPGLLAQGVRSLAQAGQRVLYRAGDYSVDLNLEGMAREPGEIVGQITNEQDGLEMLDGVVVQVLSGGETLVETATNRFGEFIIEYPAAKKSMLRFALRHRGQRIDLPLVS